MNTIRNTINDLYLNQGIQEYECKNEVSESAYEQICNLVYTYYANLNMPSVFLPTIGNIGHDWVITKSDECPIGLTGTLPKRIARYLYENYRIKADNDLMGKIGNIANDASKKRLYFDFTDKFDWRAGEFGDSNSCYWGCRASARDILIDEFNALAIRFYSKISDIRYDGFGRAWIVPYKDDSIIVYNAYPSNFKLATIARMIATLLGLNYKQINLEFNHDTCGTLWINGGAGYLIYPYASNNDYSSNSINLDYDDIRIISCQNCGHDMNEEDTDEYEEYDGDFYCRDCFNDIFSLCDCCTNYYPNSRLTEIQNGDNICRDCLSNDYSACESCGEYVRDCDLYYSNGESSGYCESCYQNLVECDSCHELYESDNVYQIDTDDDTIQLCVDCAKPYRCTLCGNIHYEDTDNPLITLNGNKRFCYDCLMPDGKNLDNHYFARCDYCHGILLKNYSTHVRYSIYPEYLCIKCQNNNVLEYIESIPTLYEIH